MLDKGASSGYHGITITSTVLQRPLYRVTAARCAGEGTVKRVEGRREYIAGLSGLQKRDVSQRRVILVRASAHQALVLMRVLKLKSTSLTRKIRVCMCM